MLNNTILYTCLIKQPHQFKISEQFIEVYFHEFIITAVIWVISESVKLTSCRNHWTLLAPFAVHSWATLTPWLSLASSCFVHVNTHSQREELIHPSDGHADLCFTSWKPTPISQSLPGTADVTLHMLRLWLSFTCCPENPFKSEIAPVVFHLKTIPSNPRCLFCGSCPNHLSSSCC